MAELSKAEILAELASRNVDTSSLSMGPPKLAGPEQSQLGDARSAASNAQAVLRDLRKFQDLQATQKDQQWMPLLNAPLRALAKLPYAKEVVTAFDPELAQMDAITARLAPAQKVEGAGSTSDKDLALFLSASPNMMAPNQANEALYERGRQEAIRRQAKAEHLDRYARDNGTLLGAEEAFRRKPLQGLTGQNPIDLSKGQSRYEAPAGAFYKDPQGNIRRNDNMDAGNPIVIPANKAKVGGNTGKTDPGVIQYDGKGNIVKPKAGNAR
jgi:hypothetical protein